MKWMVITTYTDGTITDGKFDTVREIAEYFGNDPLVLSHYIYDTTKGC